MPKQRRIRAIIDHVESYSYSELVSSEQLKELVYKETPAAIEEAIKHKSQYATIFEINNTGHYVEIHKKDWIDALNVCIAEKVEKEDYKECARLNEIIQRIESKQKPKKDGTVQPTKGGSGLDT